MYVGVSFSSFAPRSRETYLANNDFQRRRNSSRLLARRPMTDDSSPRRPRLFASPAPRGRQYVTVTLMRCRAGHLLMHELAAGGAWLPRADDVERPSLHGHRHSRPPTDTGP